MSITIEDVDFDIINEKWSYFKLKDGTLLRGRVIIRKIVRKGFHPIGYPNYDIDYTIVYSARVPKEFLREPSSKAPKIIKENVEAEFNYPDDIEILKDNVQEYETDDGFIVKVKFVPMKVLKLKQSNRYGEPIYVIYSQILINLIKKGT